MVAKRLIVNADDLGISPGVTRGILESHERGIVTSASLMVRAPDSARAAHLAQKHPRLSVGLHIDLGEWAFRDGAWAQTTHVVSTSDARAVGEEVAAQLRQFRALTGRDPTHLDSHQHVHRQEPARSILLATGVQLGIPVRLLCADVQHCFAFYGQTAEGLPIPHGVSVEAMLKVLRALKPGVTEVGCHPGYAHDLDSVYANERELELATLCDPLVKAEIDRLGIELIGFGASYFAPRTRVPLSESSSAL